MVLVLVLLLEWFLYDHMKTFLLQVKQEKVGGIGYWNGLMSKDLDCAWLQTKTNVPLLLFGSHLYVTKILS